LKILKKLAAKVAARADKGPFELFQDDTFFTCPNGRLKLRTFSATEAELIFYRRPDQTGPKESVYSIAPVTAPDKIREVLSQAYGKQAGSSNTGLYSSSAGRGCTWTKSRDWAISGVRSSAGGKRSV